MIIADERHEALAQALAHEDPNILVFNVLIEGEWGIRVKVFGADVRPVHLLATPEWVDVCDRIIELKYGRQDA